MTLIELLVSTSIVALIASLVLPSLAGARRTVRRVKCLANCRALAFAASTYASENVGWLPPSAQRYDGDDHLELSANIVRFNIVGYDLPTIMGPYVHADAFSCPENQAPPVGDPANQVETVHGPYIFLWGASQSTPQRGAIRMDGADHSLAVADFTWYRQLDNGLPVYGGNHIIRPTPVGTIPETDLARNPSAAQYVTVLKPNSIAGLNAANLSGSARWYSRSGGELRVSGPYNQSSAQNSAVYVPGK